MTIDIREFPIMTGYDDRLSSWLKFLSPRLKRIFTCQIIIQGLVAHSSNLVNQFNFYNPTKIFNLLKETIYNLEHSISLTDLKKKFKSFDRVIRSNDRIKITRPWHPNSHIFELLIFSDIKNLTGAVQSFAIHFMKTTYKKDSWYDIRNYYFNVLYDMICYRNLYNITTKQWFEYNSSWLSHPTIIALANDLSSLPILADAMEENGCADKIALDHCRQKCRHYHGCWVIDRIKLYNSAIMT
jgi:hypothetical protein